MLSNSNQPLVVLTYPGHFLLTAVTIKSYVKHHGPTDIIVIADDISQQAWSTYIEDCGNLYNCPVIPVSNLKSIDLFSGVGWIRQQIVKLHLDQLVDLDSWFFTDGDIIFLNPVETTEVPYSVPYFSETTQRQNEYVGQMLGINNVGVKLNQTQVCVSNPAFRTMSKTVLQSLREHVKTLHRQDLIDLHLPYCGPDSIAVSEWELIENFRQNVLGEELNLVKYAPHDIKNKSADLNYFTHQFLTQYGTDKDLGRDWFDKQGITVSDSVWSQLEIVVR